jgi:Fur family ferric uptake transcriptional regulator
MRDIRRPQHRPVGSVLRHPTDPKTPSICRIVRGKSQFRFRRFGHNPFEHFDAEWLIAHLARVAGERRVSRPTVYRTLSELVEAGLLRDMELGGRMVYEHDYGYPQHDHLYCVKCHKLIEFHSPDLARIREEVAHEHQFRVSGHRLIVSGICADCRLPPRKLDMV